MRKEGNIVSYTVDELDEMLARGEDQTDWERVKTLTDEEIEAAIDEEDEGTVLWSFPFTVSVNLPSKKQLTIRLDEDILDWFRAQGSGYQTRINAVLRSYVEAQKANEAPKPRRRKAS